ncbi:MAG: thioesterase family protein [Opitutaceae bacterium]|nr:thioesterase family protein [Opitutaceae bacterium]
MSFVYSRTIHFADTDAAGVVFFARYLAICHEAYEEALAAAGINVFRFFSDNGVVIPISKSNADYLRPMVCGDKVKVSLKPIRLTEDTFAIDYEIRRANPGSKLVATARTCHVCLSSATRERVDLPEALVAWITAG